MRADVRPKTTSMGEFRREKILTCDRKPQVDLEQKSSEPVDLEKLKVGIFAPRAMVDQAREGLC